jgi:dihydropyrimidinase
MLDLIIKGGLVVTPQGADVMDVGVQGDKIVAVGWPGTLAADAARVIDATGKIVVPGGIEPHAHIGIPVPEHWAGTPDVFTQPPEAASRAAAFGGVTTVIDFAGTLALDPAKAAKQESILDVLETRRSMFRGHSYRPERVRFAFHYILAGEVPAATVGQIGEAIQEGVASFKIFTTFRPIRVPYGHLWSIFAEVAKHGGIMAVHAEEDDVVTFMTEKLKAEGGRRAITSTSSTTTCPRISPFAT